MKRNALGFLILVVSCVGTVRADGKPTLEDVKKAQKARQDASKSFRVEWTESVTVKADSRPRVKEFPGPQPPEDHEFTATHSLSVDGDKMSAVYSTQTYELRKQAWRLTSGVDASDGQTVTSVQPSAQTGWMEVTIEKGADPTRSRLNSTTHVALFWVHRPLGGGAAVPIDLNNYRLTERSQKIDERECVALEMKEPGPGASYLIWLDPTRGFLPVRSKSRIADGSGADREWSYRKDTAGRWTLSGWQSTQLGPKGVLRSSFKAEVKKFDFDPKFAAEAFTPKPPPMSHVIVPEDGVPKEQRLIRPDGSKRVISATEARKSFDELAKTNADGTPYTPAKK